MAIKTYEVLLSTSGRPSVRVRSDELGDVEEVLSFARNHLDLCTATSAPVTDPVQDGQDEVPVCAVHHVPMTWQQGKYGEF